ncbi:MULTISPECIES: flagellar motor switch protein FliG [Rhodospirillales]|uniref:Flagellar motor switch protein FliG n=3 Tax=Rhodospirillales TaxID=204441 RepID=B6IQ92_RHOCS|nr:flagellar motor switch protein FliG [Rhodospirillum centenum]AAF35852.1 lateral flagellar motor switch protein FliG [Rhodospirillum centenum]ACI97628.1 flagellar motor switch protein FliG [Rhodospirillum centenum SW]
MLPKIRSDYKSLTGLEKTAVILLALGEERGARLMERLEDDEIRDVSYAMAGLGTVSGKVVERLIRDFSERFAGTGEILGGFDSTERFLARFLPSDRVQEILSELRGPAGRTMWEKLSNVNEQVLANYLRNEHPQTIAVVLTRIRPEHAAKVLGLLPGNLVQMIVSRIIKMEAVPRDVLEDVEKTLRSEFMANYVRAHGHDSHAIMAEILNRTDKELFEQIMDPLEKRMPESATRIKQLMFTFEDLARLDPQAIQTVIRNTDSERLAYALKGLDDPIQQVFLENMSERAAALLREEMDLLGAVRARDVEEARDAILRTTKLLAEEGQIVINRGSDSAAYLVY